MNAEKTFQTSSFNLTAGQPKDFGIVCNQIMVESATGIITFKTTDGTFIASVGRGYRFDSPAKIINISSSVSESVTLTYGMGLILFNPAWASSGGGGITNVNNTPVGPDLMQGPGGLVPLRSNDGVSLDVAALNEATGIFGVATAVNFSVARHRTLRLVIFAGTVGDSVLISGPDITLPPCIIYDKYGNVVSRTGLVTIGPVGSFVTVGTELFINTAGWLSINFTPVVGVSVAFSPYFSPYPAIPEPPSVLNLTLADTLMPTGISTVRSFSQVIPGSFNRAQIYLKQHSTATSNLAIRAWLCDETGTITGQAISVSLVASGAAQELVWQFGSVVGEQYYQIVGTSQGGSATGPAPLPSFGWRLSLELDAGVGVVDNLNISLSKA